MTLWFCKNCRSNYGRSCGPWNDDKGEFFKRIKQFHKNHPGFQIGVTCSIDNLTEIEQAATNCLLENSDEWFHNLVAKLKGPSKVCLIKDKWKWVSST